LKLWAIQASLRDAMHLLSCPALKRRAMIILPLRGVKDGRVDYFFKDHNRAEQLPKIIETNEMFLSCPAGRNGARFQFVERAHGKVIIYL
jgi:hypothetical protein